ncbi:MAG TPA: choice-of-anchor tandem repeat NxxGxxAF-containing protein [Candidatus Binatia bacterium]
MRTRATSTLPPIRRFASASATALLAGVLLAAWTSCARAALFTLASTGQAAPGSGTFGAHFGWPVINDAGQVAFSTFTSGPSDTDDGVYQGTKSSDLTAFLRLDGQNTTSIDRSVAQNVHGVVTMVVNGGTVLLARDSGGLQTLLTSNNTLQFVGNGPMYPVNGIGDPSINDIGDVAVLVNANGGAALAGGVAVGYVGEGDLANGQVVQIDSPIGIDGAGNVVFLLTNDSNAFPFGVNVLAVNSVSGGVLTDLVTSGVTGIGADKLGIGFPTTSAPMIDGGNIAFRTVTSDPSTPNSDAPGVFLIQRGGITRIAKGGDAAPGGGTFSKIVNGNEALPFDEPQVNANGSVAFVGWTDGGPGHGVYRWTQAHGLEALALEGQAPYAAAAGFRNVLINDHDVVAFQAFDGSAGNHRGVYMTDGSTTVHAGSDDFFGPEGSLTGAFQQGYYGGPAQGLSALNNRGEVTFVTGTAASQSVVRYTLDPSWRKTVGGSWDVADNWTFTTLPSPGSVVTIAADKESGPLVVTGPAAPTSIAGLIVGSATPEVGTPELDLQPGGPITASSAFDVLDGKLGGSGTVTAAELIVLASGTMDGTFTLNGFVESAGTLHGTMTINGGVDNLGVMDGDFTVNGDVTNQAGASITGNQTFNGNVTNMGTIAPGHSPGTVGITGDLTLQSQLDQGTLTGSNLEIQIGGPNPGTDYDVINVTGNVTLAGKLHVTFINGFTPSPGQTFHVLNAGGSTSGAFDVVTGATVTSTQGGLDIAPLGAAASAPKALVKCASTIAKAGSGYTSARFKALDACVVGVFKCIQENDPGTKRDACVAKAGISCSKDLARIDGLATKLGGAIDKACAPVGASDTLNPAGVGFQNVADDCMSAFATPLDTLATVEQCVRRSHDCRSDAVLDAQAPRARQLMALAGVPSDALDALGCLPANGSGGDLGAPKGAGKAVTACEVTLAKVGDALVAKVEKSLTACVGAVYACVTEKPGDAPCITKAQTGCAKDFTAIGDATTAFEGALAKSCAAPALAFADLAGPDGANVQVLAADCAALGVATLTSPTDYSRCLERRVACVAEDLVRFEAPRAGEMLALVGHPLQSPFCP